MTVSTAQVVVGTSPVLIGAEKTKIRFAVEGGDVIVVGGSDVTASTGLQLTSPARAFYLFDLDRGDDLYAVVSAGTKTITVLSQG